MLPRLTSIVLFVYVMAALSCAAQSPPQTVLEATEAIVHIRVRGIGLESGDVEAASGTGALLHKGRVVVTCGHLFWVEDDPEDRTVLHTLTMSRPIVDGTSIRRLDDLLDCTPNPWVDISLDSAVLLFGGAGGVPIQYLELDPTGVSLEEEVWIAGYDSPPSITLIDGTAHLQSDTTLWIRIEELPEPGMSGAPVLNEAGHIVAVLTASYGSRYAVATLVTAIPALWGKSPCAVGIAPAPPTLHQGSEWALPTARAKRTLRSRTQSKTQSTLSRGPALTNPWVWASLHKGRWR